MLEWLSDAITVIPPVSLVESPGVPDETPFDVCVSLAINLSDTSNRFQSERCSDSVLSVVWSSTCSLCVSSKQNARFLTPISTLRILQGEAGRLGLFVRSTRVLHREAFVPVEFSPVRNARCLSCHAFRLDKTVKGSTLVIFVDGGRYAFSC
jgi:hypothetical protein